MEFTIVLECDVKPDDDSNFIAECQQKFPGLKVEHFHGLKFYFTGAEQVLRDFITNHYNVFATEKDVKYYFDMYMVK